MTLWDIFMVRQLFPGNMTLWFYLVLPNKPPSFMSNLWLSNFHHHSSGWVVYLYLLVPTLTFHIIVQRNWGPRYPRGRASPRSCLVLLTAVPFLPDHALYWGPTFVGCHAAEHQGPIARGEERRAVRCNITLWPPQMMGAKCIHSIYSTILYWVLSTCQGLF